MINIVNKIIKPIFGRTDKTTPKFKYSASKDTRSEYLFLRDRSNDPDYLKNIGRLSRGIFHDMISPLNGILMHIESMKRSGILENYNYAQDLLSSNKRLLDFIDQIRLLITNQSEPEIINLNKMCLNAVILLKHKATENNISIVTAHSQPIVLSCIPCRIQQVLLVLLDNAINACINNGSAKNYITVTTASVRNEIIIRIKDSGCGFNVNKTRKVGGCGLGLSHANSIIKNEHDGRIEIENTDQGSQVSVFIPRKNKY